jgi:NAD(P)-dependent dehydrogenase (short-subunit alcohol dehydrogenase family)
MELSGAAVIVTGAARGIGKAIAGAFAGRGAKVALVDVLAEEVEAAAAELGAAGGEALPLVCDITVAEQVEAMAAEAAAKLGPPSVLVNNAGSLSVLAPVWEADPARWCRDVAVNLCGTFLVTRYVVPHMLAAGGYVISLIGAGVTPPHLYTTAYDTSKAGVARLMEALAKEAEQSGARITTFVLSPGMVRTEMARYIADSPEGRKWRPSFGERFHSDAALPTPEMAAETCLRLASGRADALSGRYLSSGDDFEELLAAAEEIVQGERRVLRLT